MRKFRWAKAKDESQIHTFTTSLWPTSRGLYLQVVLWVTILMRCFCLSGKTTTVSFSWISLNWLVFHLVLHLIWFGCSILACTIFHHLTRANITLERIHVCPLTCAVHAKWCTVQPRGRLPRHVQKLGPHCTDSNIMISCERPTSLNCPDVGMEKSVLLPSGLFSGGKGKMYWLFLAFSGRRE